MHFIEGIWFDAWKFGRLNWALEYKLRVFLEQVLGVICVALGLQITDPVKKNGWSIACSED